MFCYEVYLCKVWCQCVGWYSRKNEKSLSSLWEWIGKKISKWRPPRPGKKFEKVAMVRLPNFCLVYMCQIWWTCGENKGLKNAKSEIFFAAVKLHGGKFKDRNRALHCSTLSVIAVVYGSKQFLEVFSLCDLGMTLTLNFKVKVTRPHRDLSNKKKIIDLSHTVTEIHAFEVHTYYIGPIF